MSSATIRLLPDTARPRGFASWPGGIRIVCWLPSSSIRWTRFCIESLTKMYPDPYATPPPAGESLPPPRPKKNWPAPVPRPLILPISAPVWSKKSSVSVPPSVSTTVPVGATVIEETAVNCPGWIPGVPNCLWKVPSGANTWTRCECWSPT